jgi:hypothetical protein
MARRVIWRRIASTTPALAHDTLTEDLTSYRAQLRLAVRLRPGRDCAGRSAGGANAFVAAAPLGEGLHPDLPQAAADHSIAPVVRRESRSVLPSDGELQLHPDVRALHPDVSSMVIRYNMAKYEMILIDVRCSSRRRSRSATFYVVCQREIHTDWLARLSTCRS